MAGKDVAGSVRALVGLIGLSTLGGVVQPSCLERRARDDSRAQNPCIACHGSVTNPGDPLAQSAPPSDLSGNRTPEYPGVGAHTAHLRNGETHPGIACRECHVVPKETRSPGHADSALPADLVFGPLASLGGRVPSYDMLTRRCADTYCHGNTDSLWTQPRDSAAACGTCHGLPPAPPHPASEQCSACHDGMRSDRSFANPSTHVDGQVQVREPTCNACHGGEHGPAPPLDRHENTGVTARGVGAHTVHLTGGGAGRSLACDECHTVPLRVDSPGHLDRAPAEVRFRGVALHRERNAEYDVESLTCSETWCHGPSVRHAPSPLWTNNTKLGCTDCHGMPPPKPHPQIAACSRCHGSVVAADNHSIIDRTRHVDGAIDLEISGLNCTTCHGGKTPAPPPDLSGNLTPDAPGVGAHTTHLTPGDRARVVACNECHRVPATLNSPDHIDTAAPAEVTFSGVATAFDAKPQYENGSCKHTFCHGGSFVGWHPSGGSITEPTWTRVDGSQAACGTCHALAPPAPHPPNAAQCSDCHGNIAANLRFTRPELHVDGEVTFVLP